MAIDLDRVNQYYELPNGKFRRLTVDDEFIHRAQRRHFIQFDILPLLGTCLAIGLLFFHPIGYVEIGLFTVMWLLTGLGITAGYHRLFAHQSYKTVPAVRALLTILGSMSGRGSMISWAAMHRRHHEVADEPGDMHSPNLHGTGWKNRLRGFFHAHYTWMIQHEYPNVAHYAPDLLRDKAVLKASRRYNVWVVLGLVIPAILGGLLTQSWMGVLTGFLWGGVVRMFVVEQAMSALNSFLHTIGSHPFKLDDESRNSVLLGLFAWGEGWHNNHHAFPNSASFGLAKHRVDLGYWFILLLQALGLAWDVRVPTRDQIATRAATLATRYAASQGSI